MTNDLAFTFHCSKCGELITVPEVLTYLDRLSLTVPKVAELKAKYHSCMEVVEYQDTSL